MGKNFEIIFREFANSETFVMSRGLLEDYKRQAAQEERERIFGQITAWGEDAGCFCCASDAAAADLIDFIKGENK